MSQTAMSSLGSPRRRRRSGRGLVLAAAALLVAPAPAQLARVHVNDGSLGSQMNQTFGDGFAPGSRWLGSGTIHVLAGDLTAPLGSGYAETQPYPGRKLQGEYGAPRMSTRPLPTPAAASPLYVSFLVQPVSAGSHGGVVLNSAASSDPTDTVDAVFVGVVDGDDLEVDTDETNDDDVRVPDVFTPGQTSLVVLKIEHGVYPHGADRITVWVDDGAAPIVRLLFDNVCDEIATLGIASWDDANDEYREGAVIDDIILSATPPIALLEPSFDSPTFVFAVDAPVSNQTQTWTHAVAAAGDYQLGLAWIDVVSGTQVAAEVFINDMRVRAFYAPVGETSRFETRLEDLAAGDQIMVRAAPLSGSNYRIAFQIALATPSFDGLPTFDVAAFGAVGDGATDDRAAIQAAVTAAARLGGVVNFDGAKTYRVLGATSLDIETLFELNGASNVRLAGNGATLLLQPPDRLAEIFRCDNVQIDGFAVAYDPLPYYQGTITDIDVGNRTIDIVVPPRYPAPSPGRPAGDLTFGRSFIPDAPGARSGDGDNIYFDLVTANGGPREVRMHVPAIGNGADMTPRLQRAADEGATEFIAPPVEYGHRGHFSIVVKTDNSRIRFSDIAYECTPQFFIAASDNAGPVTFSNVDIQTPAPETELFVSWRDGYHARNNRWGLLLEGGDWDGAAMYDDTYAIYMRAQPVLAVAGDTLTLGTEKVEGLFRPGDWVSVWTPDQSALRGMSRVVAVDLDTGDDTFLVELEAMPPGAGVDDIALNEEALNRDTVIRDCTVSSIGAGVASTRIRTGVRFSNNTFADIGLRTEFLAEFSPPRVRDLVLENCRFIDSEQIRLQRTLGAVVRECTLENTSILAYDGAENVYLDGVVWTDAAGDIAQLRDGSAAWLFGAAMRNGESAGLSGWVDVQSGSTIAYAAPSGYPPGTPPSGGEDVAPPPPPTALSAVSAGAGVLLDWEPSSAPDLYGYAVYRSAASGGPYGLLASNVTSSRYLDATVPDDALYYYVVTASDNSGNESGFSTQQIGVAALTLRPVADAYVWGGDFSDRNYGDEDVLRCKTDSENEQWTREPYLRFDLSVLPASVQRATLRLKAADANGSGDVHACHFVADDGWGEMTITWDDKPAVGAALDAAPHPDSNDWLVLDVTDQVVQELAGDESCSFALRASGAVLVAYHARETAAEAERPALVVELGQICVGDVNGDRQTDAADFQALTAVMGTDDSAADLNGSGLVDLRDASLVQRDMGCQ